MSGSLDANIVLRFLVGDITNQFESAAKLLKNSQRLVVEDIAIAECVFVMSRAYGMSRADIAKAMGGFISLEVVDCNQAVINEALHEFVKHPALSFEDCCLAAYAGQGDQAPLFTFDKKLANQSPNAELLK